MTEYADREAAEADYESYMAQEAEDLLSYLIVSKPTQAVTQRAQEVIRAIYSHAQYTVAPAEELEDVYKRQGWAEHFRRAKSGVLGCGSFRATGPWVCGKLEQVRLRFCA